MASSTSSIRDRRAERQTTTPQHHLPRRVGQRTWRQHERVADVVRERIAHAAIGYAGRVR